MDREPKKYAISVKNLSKTFKIPHEKHTSLKATVLNAFNNNGFQIFKALDDLSFDVTVGEFIGIIGKNGSGKSTLLKILAGIYDPDKKSGAVEINGKLSPFLELGVGFNSELTGRENLFLGGAVLGLTKKEVAQRYDRIVEFSELEEFMDLKFKNYSSGMQVRLAFALAINAHADILLMDEVLAVGDINFQNKCLNEFDRYKKEGKTIVFVSHDIDTVKKYCDKVIWIKDSKLKQIGKAKEVCDNYLKSLLSENMKEVSGNKESSYPRIIGTEYLSVNNKPKDSYKQGEDIMVRVQFSPGKVDARLNFGLAIFNKSEQYIQGVNSDELQYNFKKVNKAGYFEITLINPPLRGGIYYAKAAISGAEKNSQYDFYNSPNYFSVEPSDGNQGDIAIDYKWNI